MSDVPFVFEGEADFVADTYEPWTGLAGTQKSFEQVIVDHFGWEEKRPERLSGRFRITVERLSDE